MLPLAIRRFQNYHENEGKFTAKWIPAWRLIKQRSLVLREFPKKKEEKIRFSSALEKHSREK